MAGIRCMDALCIVGRAQFRLQQLLGLVPPGTMVCIVLIMQGSKHAFALLLRQDGSTRLFEFSHLGSGMSSLNKQCVSQSSTVHGRVGLLVKGA